MTPLELVAKFYAMGQKLQAAVALSKVAESLALRAHVQAACAQQGGVQSMETASPREAREPVQPAKGATPEEPREPVQSVQAAQPLPATGLFRGDPELDAFIDALNRGETPDLVSVSTQLQGNISDLERMALDLPSEASLQQRAEQPPQPTVRRAASQGARSAPARVTKRSSLPARPRRRERSAVVIEDIPAKYGTNKQRLAFIALKANDPNCDRVFNEDFLENFNTDRLAEMKLGEQELSAGTLAHLKVRIAKAKARIKKRCDRTKTSKKQSTRGAKMQAFSLALSDDDRHILEAVLLGEI